MNDIGDTPPLRVPAEIGHLIRRKPATQSG